MYLLSVVLYAASLWVVFADDKEVSHPLHQNVLNYIKNYIRDPSKTSVEHCNVYKNCNKYKKPKESSNDEVTIYKGSRTEENDNAGPLNKPCTVYKNCNTYKKQKESNEIVFSVAERMTERNDIALNHQKPCPVYKNCNNYRAKQPRVTPEASGNYLPRRMAQDYVPVQDLGNLSETSDDLPSVGRLSFTPIKGWMHVVKLARKPISFDITAFQAKWSKFLPVFTTESLKSNNEARNTVPVRLAVEIMSRSDDFIQVFWPFRFDIAKMNQILATHGLASLSSSHHNTKMQFFKALRRILMTDFPAEEKNIVISFSHPELVQWLNQTNLVSYSQEFVQSGRHRFNKAEEILIRVKTEQALQLINLTSPEIFKSITQLVGCIAYYKSENPGYISGTIPNTIGVLWIDPSGEGEWSVPFYAEQIVHEYIHTALFYAELVHGVYARHDLLTKVKTVSAIRRELRDFDRSFHAAYVSAGLVTFNARVGCLDRAEQMAATLRSSVNELTAKNKEWGVLTESGTAMLQFLQDYNKITRIQ